MCYNDMMHNIGFKKNNSFSICLSFCFKISVLIINNQCLTIKAIKGGYSNKLYVVSIRSEVKTVIS